MVLCLMPSSRSRAKMNRETHREEKTLEILQLALLRTHCRELSVHGRRRVDAIPFRREQRTLDTIRWKRGTLGIETRRPTS